jgi:carbonic anhydrase
MQTYHKLHRSVLQLGLLALLCAAALVQAQDRQSPADFNAHDVDQVKKLPKVKVTMSNHVTLSVLNTWNPADTSVNGGPLPKEYCTVKVSVLDGAGSVSVDGRAYNLLQFHYHTPAEHTVDREHAPMEVHFVFLDSQKQAGEPNSLLVVGAGMVEGKADKDLAKIFSQLPPSQYEGHRFGLQPRPLFSCRERHLPLPWQFDCAGVSSPLHAQPRRAD